MDEGDQNSVGEVRDISGGRGGNGKAGEGMPWKSKKGFGYRVRQAEERPKPHVDMGAAGRW